MGLAYMALKVLLVVYGTWSLEIILCKQQHQNSS